MGWFELKMCKCSKKEEHSFLFPLLVREKNREKKRVSSSLRRVMGQDIYLLVFRQFEVEERCLETSGRGRNGHCDLKSPRTQ